MNSLPDPLLKHLLRVTSEPDLSQTRYRLLGPLGAGGLGSVWEVEDPVLQRRVALKVLHAPGEILAEAQLAAALEHPGIAPVHDVGHLPDGRSFYTMRLVRGRHLSAAIPAGTPIRERLRLWSSLAETLAFAHSRGVHHRDLKPDNVLVGDFGELVILDWGLASRLPSNSTDNEALGRLLTFCLPPRPPRPLAAIAEASYPSVEARLADVRAWQDGLPVSVYQERLLETLVRWAHHNQVLLLLLISYVLVKFLLFFLRPT